jgi:hypothetical protein
VHTRPGYNPENGHIFQLAGAMRRVMPTMVGSDNDERILAHPGFLESAQDERQGSFHNKIVS